MKTEDVPLGIGLNYIRFAIEEPHLFRFLFQSGFAVEGSLPEMLDSAELTPIRAAMQGALGMSAAQTKQIFLTAALFTRFDPKAPGTTGPGRSVPRRSPPETWRGPRTAGPCPRRPSPRRPRGCRPSAPVWAGSRGIPGNLLTGRGGLETFVQVLFAIAWGFLFTLVFYHSGSLLVCIFVHGMVDVFSKFAATQTARLSSAFAACGGKQRPGVPAVSIKRPAGKPCALPGDSCLPWCSTTPAVCWCVSSSTGWWMSSPIVAEGAPDGDAHGAIENDPRDGKPQLVFFPFFPRCRGYWGWGPDRRRRFF